jgi:flagellar motility protein MotE (MotC chaperone)
MNRIIEIAAMAIGGMSLFLVAFVGFAALSGKDMSQVAVVGKLFPAPPDEAEGEGEHAEVPGETEAGGAEEHGEGLSDAAVVEASLGLLSAWTLPSPYSTTELRVLTEEIKKKHEALEAEEHALARRERAVVEDEHELEERVKTLEELRAHLESLQQEVTERENDLAAREAAFQAGKDSRWAAVARVIGGLEEAAEAATRLQEYSPQDAAKILVALGDDERAGEILNQVQGPRWKEFVDAYTAERALAPAKKKP